MGYPSAGAAPRHLIDWGAAPSTLITLPWQSPPLTLNRTARGHVQQHAAKRAEVRRDVGLIARALKLDRLPVPAIVGLYWFPARNSSMADPDGLAATLKPCIDGLRDAGVLEDDSPRHVWMTYQRVVPLSEDPHRHKSPRMVLAIHHALWITWHTPEPGPAGKLTRLVDPFDPPVH